MNYARNSSIKNSYLTNNRKQNDKPVQHKLLASNNAILEAKYSKSKLSTKETLKLPNYDKKNSNFNIDEYKTSRRKLDSQPKFKIKESSARKLERQHKEDHSQASAYFQNMKLKIHVSDEKRRQNSPNVHLKVSRIIVFLINFIFIS